MRTYEINDQLEFDAAIRYDEDSRQEHHRYADPLPA